MSDLPPAQPASPAPRPPPRRVGHWRQTLLVAGVVLAAYLLLLNPYWTPGGDSELFLAVARSVLRGEGYSYNAKPVAIAPPAWPYTVAAALWVSPTFLFVKLVTLSLMAGAWTLAHRVLLRLGPARWATAAACLAAVFVPVYSLTFWLHTEPMFCCFAWGATLCAARAAEDRRRAGSLLGLIGLCALMAATRWTSGLQWGIVAAVLVGGWRPTWRRPGVDRRVALGVGLSGAVTILVFLLLFFGLPAIASAGEAPPLAPAPPAAAPDDAALPVTQQDAEDETPDLLGNDIFRGLNWWQERGYRLAQAGQWPAWTLWYPARFAGGLPTIDLVPLAVGWVVLLLLGLTAWDALVGRRDVGRFPLGRYVWAALVGYVFLLVFVWPLPNARYLVPVAPLLVMGTLWGCRGVGERLGRPAVGKWLGRLFLASLVVVNGAMFAVDAAIQRSGDAIFGGSPQRYYARYEAGLHLSLLQAVGYLRDHGVRDRELAVSERYFNLNRMRFSKGGPRNAVMLLDRDVTTPSEYYSFPPGEIPRRLFRIGVVDPGGFRAWARRGGIKYYLYQEPSEPWRLWHFRVPASLERRLAGPPEEGEQGPSFGWRLYSAEDDFDKPIDLSGRDYPIPTRLPGL